MFNKPLVSLLNIQNIPQRHCTLQYRSLSSGIHSNRRQQEGQADTAQTNAEWGSLPQVQHLGGIKKFKKSIPINQKLPIPFYSSRKKVELCSVRQRIPGLKKKEKRKDITTRKTVRNDLLFLFLNTVA